MKKMTAEFIGTFALVLFGCGSAVFAGAHIGWLGVAFAFGISVTTMAYAIGSISGCHLNPAVTLGLCAAGRFEAKNVLGYIVAQVLGAIAAAGVIYVIANGIEGGYAMQENSLAVNGYAELSPNHYSLAAGFIGEAVFTFLFLIVIIGATSAKAPAGFAGLAIGLSLFIIHLALIPVTNTSVNPARSIGPALFVGGKALSQLWLFIVAPIIGAVIAGLVWRNVFEEKA